MNIRLRNMTSLYLWEEDRVLCLFRRGSRVADRKFVGAAGGHFECPELNDPLACVLREAREELGLEPEALRDLRLRYITHRLTGGEIRQNYYYFARLAEPTALHSTEGDLQWVPMEQVSGLDMPISAKQMLEHFVRRGRFDRCLYAGITRERDTEFVVMEDF